MYKYNKCIQLFFKKKLGLVFKKKKKKYVVKKIIAVKPLSIKTKYV